MAISSYFLCSTDYAQMFSLCKAMQLVLDLKVGNKAWGVVSVWRGSQVLLVEIEHACTKDK